MVQHRVRVLTDRRLNTSTPFTAACRDCEFVSNPTHSKPVAEVYARAHSRDNTRDPEPDPVTSFNPGLIRVVVESFGYLHGPAPVADITLDLRSVARDPDTSPWMRELTGLDQVIRTKILNGWNVQGVIGALVTLTARLVPGRDAAGEVVQVALGCAGGRHRSVVLANELVNRLNEAGIGADVSHRDILRPVVTR